MQRCDLVVIGAHPDDAELWAGGALARAVRQGYRAGIVDATAGEMGTRGSPATRRKEAARAAEVLGVATRVCLGLPDGRLRPGEEERAALVGTFRALRPEVVIAPHWESRHPDHRALSTLVREAAFLSGLARFPAEGAAWKPRKLLFALAYLNLPPSFILDVSEDFPTKIKAIRAYGSQVRSMERLGDVMPAGRPVIETIERLHAAYGAQVQARYGEPYHQGETMRVDDLMALPALSV